MTPKKSSGSADSSRAPAESPCDTAEKPTAAPAGTPPGATAGTPPGTTAGTPPGTTASAPRKPRAATPRSAPSGAPRAADPFLGHAQAVLIACKCANTIPANLARTLSELGVNGIPFQQAVRTAVKAAGYTIGADDVPGAPGTRLVQIVTIIQNARRSA